MEIKNIEIKYFKKGAFTFTTNETVRHVKILPFLSVVQSVEGSYDITLGNGNTEQTGERGFFIAPSGIEQTIVHHPDKKSGKMICRWIFIDVDINRTYKLDSLFRFPTVVKDSEKAELNDLFELLFAAEDVWEIHSICYKLLGCLTKKAMPTKKKTHPFVENALAYMMEHYTTAITVETLANVAKMSASNFHAAFKKYCGTSPIAYLNHYRLSVAESLLVETDDTVNQISDAVGIKDSFYFSKLFKKTYGVSPREYREARRKARISLEKTN